MNIKPAIATAAPHPLLHYSSTPQSPSPQHDSLTLVNYLNELTGGHFQQAAAQMAHSSALAALAAQQQQQQQQSSSPVGGDVDDVEHSFESNDHESHEQLSSRKRLRSDATDESDVDSSNKHESDDESAISEDADSEPIARKKHNNGGYSSDDLSSSKSLQNVQGQNHHSSKKRQHHDKKRSTMDDVLKRLNKVQSNNPKQLRSQDDLLLKQKNPLESFLSAGLPFDLQSLVASPIAGAEAPGSAEQRITALIENLQMLKQQICSPQAASGAPSLVSSSLFTFLPIFGPIPTGFPIILLCSK